MNSPVAGFAATGENPGNPGKRPISVIHRMFARRGDASLNLMEWMAPASTGVAMHHDAGVKIGLDRSHPMHVTAIGLGLMTEAVHENGALAAIELVHNRNHAQNLMSRAPVLEASDRSLNAPFSEQPRAMDKDETALAVLSLVAGVACRCERWI